VKNQVHEQGVAHPVETAGAGPAPIVVEEEALLRVVLAKLDAPPLRARTVVDDTATLIELRDALAEAKPEDQGPLLEQMHRIEAILAPARAWRERPGGRGSPYFGHLRLLQDGRRRDVLIGQRGYVEPGGGVQIVDWRNAPVSRLFYRYDEGDCFEERLGEREVAGEVLARRTVTIVEAELRRVACVQGIFSRESPDHLWRSLNLDKVRLGVAPWAASPSLSSQFASPELGPRLGFEKSRATKGGPVIAGHRGAHRPSQFELISRPSSGVIVVQGSAGSGKTTIGLHRIAYLNFAEPGYFRPQDMLVIVYQRALAAYVSRVLPELQVPGVNVRTFASWAEEVAQGYVGRPVLRYYRQHTAAR